MDASTLEALVFDRIKCSKLSMDQKREIVYEISNFPESSADMLQAWSRQELLQILCVEQGKERKHSILTKSKIIEHLLKTVYQKKSQVLMIANVTKEKNDERIPKRQRKSDHPNHFVVDASVVVPDADSGGTLLYCENSACKAKLSHDCGFCKRCSCCICRKYDDNKDPSLWLICNSDPPFHGVSCGMSCHLECALLHENSGISQDRQDKGLDGSFSCVSCGKVNDLLGSWRKQLLVARDTRRVDILCYRLSLGQKILAGTKHYQNLYGINDEAVRKLEQDVGPLTGLPVKKARGIVNRLSSGPEIQRLCASAVDSLDLMLSNRVSDTPSDCNMVASKLVRFEDIRASSLTVILNSDDSNLGYSVWHKKADEIDYPTEPTCRLFTPNANFILSGLKPETRYFLKVVTLNTHRDTGFLEFQFQTGNSREELPNLNSKSPEISTLSNPSSVEDETNNNVLATTTNGPTNPNIDVISLSDDENSCMPPNKESSNGPDNGPDGPIRPGLECVPYVGSLPNTPCKFENGSKGKDVENRPKRGSEPGSSSKKRSGDEGFEYYVKIIRWLECDGHIDTEFRQKFLTWYSLRATPQEVRVVKVFVDTFMEDPECLAEQLVDAFSDVVSSKRCSSVVPAGFCTKLWH